MKKPKPVPPTDAPPGTIWFGGPIQWFSLALIVRGEHLVPEEITALMGRKPDSAAQKGKPLYRKDGSFMRVPKHGSWSVELNPNATDEWDCGEAMLELLSSLPSDVALWRNLAARYRISFSVGLRMSAANKGFELSPAVQRYLGEREITTGFDIYFEPADRPDERKCLV